MYISERFLSSYIQSSQRAIERYGFNEPFSHFLKTFFRENKKMGSRDRKIIARFCYNYFRIGEMGKSFPFETRLLFAEFLCEKESTLVKQRDEILHESINDSLEEKFKMLCKNFSLDFEAEVRLLFPLSVPFSEGIEKPEFYLQQLIQPLLFLRVKAGEKENVKSFFKSQDIHFSELSDQALSLKNTTPLHSFLEMRKHWEVQDLSSQRTLDFFPKEMNHEFWWDACAGSGGKSMMLLDAFPELQLYITDIRTSILKNLKKRFSEAQMTQQVKWEVKDLSQEITLSEDSDFDGILLDVPCSGSGTWGRTPEMKAQVRKEDVLRYSALQKRIAKNTSPFLKKGGCLMYVTCSVFKAENEDVVEYIQSELGLTLDMKKLIKGDTHRADTLFVARFYK